MKSTDNAGTQPEFDYEQVEGVLADSDCEASAAEVQAFFCGMLAAGLPSTDTSWSVALADMVNEGHQMNSDALAVLQQVFLWTAREMSQNDSLAPLLLPDDQYPPVDQLEAIVDWSQGFLLGFGLQSGNITVDNAEVKESLTDLVEICRLDLDAEDNDETQEALMTLIEHVRVAVQIIHWEMVMKNTPNVVTRNDDSNEETPTYH